MDHSPWGSFVNGILQARILQWVAISSSRGSSQPRDRTPFLTSPALAGRFFTTSTPHKAEITPNELVTDQSGFHCWQREDVSCIWASPGELLKRHEWNPMVNWCHWAAGGTPSLAPRAPGGSKRGCHLLLWASKSQSSLFRGEQRASTCSSSFVSPWVGTSLVVQGLRLHIPNVGGMGSISSWGTRILHGTDKINKYSTYMYIIFFKSMSSEKYRPHRERSIFRWRSQEAQLQLHLPLIQCPPGLPGLHRVPVHSQSHSEKGPCLSFIHTECPKSQGKGRARIWIWDFLTSKICLFSTTFRVPEVVHALTTWWHAFLGGGGGGISVPRISLLIRVPVTLHESPL